MDVLLSSLQHDHHTIHAYAVTEWMVSSTQQVQEELHVKWPLLQEHYFDSLWLFTGLLVATVVLELISYQTTRALLAKNKRLYGKGVALNLFNHYILGPPGYVLCQVYLTQELPATTSSTTSYVYQIYQVGFIMAFHSVCFYSVHKLMHSHPFFYQFHKFHHLFNTHVPPMAANAVSPVEYLVGYCLPFLGATLLARYVTYMPSLSLSSASFGTLPITPLAFWASIWIEGIFNLIMHTPPLEPYYMNNNNNKKDHQWWWTIHNIIPKWLFVSTHDHLEHHKRLNCHYAAPTLDWDYILQRIAEMHTRGRSILRRLVVLMGTATATNANADHNNLWKYSK